MHFSWVPILNHDLNFIPLVKQPGILNIFHEVEDLWRKATRRKGAFWCRSHGWCTWPQGPLINHDKTTHLGMVCATYLWWFGGWFYYCFTMFYPHQTNDKPLGPWEYSQTAKACDLFLLSWIDELGSAHCENHRFQHGYRWPSKSVCG